MFVYKQWNVYSVNVFCFTKFSFFWNQIYNSLKSNIFHSLGVDSANPYSVCSFISNLLLVLVFFTLYSVGGNILFQSMALLNGKVIEVLKSIFHSLNIYLWCPRFVDKSEPCCWYILKLYAAFNFDFKGTKGKNPK